MLLAIFAFGLLGFFRSQVRTMYNYDIKFNGPRVIGFHKIAWNSHLPFLLVLLIILLIMFSFI